MLPFPREHLWTSRGQMATAGNSALATTLARSRAAAPPSEERESFGGARRGSALLRLSAGPASSRRPQRSRRCSAGPSSRGRLPAPGSRGRPAGSGVRRGTVASPFPRGGSQARFPTGATPATPGPARPGRCRLVTQARRFPPSHRRAPRPGHAAPGDFPEDAEQEGGSAGKMPRPRPRPHPPRLPSRPMAARIPDPSATAGPEINGRAPPSAASAPASSPRAAGPPAGVSAAPSVLLLAQRARLPVAPPGTAPPGFQAEGRPSSQAGVGGNVERVCGGTAGRPPGALGSAPSREQGPRSRSGRRREGRRSEGPRPVGGEASVGAPGAPSPPSPDALPPPRTPGKGREAPPKQKGRLAFPSPAPRTVFGIVPAGWVSGAAGVSAGSFAGRQERLVGRLRTSAKRAAFIRGRRSGAPAPTRLPLSRPSRAGLALPASGLPRPGVPSAKAARRTPGEG